MVLNMDPVADLPSIAVHRQMLVGQRSGDHQWNELFRKLERAVIIRAAGHDCGKTVGLHRRKDQKVRCSFAGSIRTRGSKRRRLAELPFAAEASIDLVGTHVHKAGDTSRPASFHQTPTPLDIGLNERRGVLNAAINMTLCRKVDNRIASFGNVGHRRVADIQAHKPAAGTIQCFPFI